MSSRSTTAHARRRITAPEYTREHGENIPEVADWHWAEAVEGDVRGVNAGTGLAADASTGGDNE